jgi:hypothetical protein
MTSPIQPRHSPEAEMARKVKGELQRANDVWTVIESLKGSRK